MKKYILLYTHDVWDDNGSDYFPEETYETCDSIEECERLAKSIGLCSFYIAQMVYEQKGNAFSKTIIPY